MDTQNESTAVTAVQLQDLHRKKLVVGVKQLRKALANGRAKQVYLAEDADPALTEMLMELSRERNVSCTWVRSMSDLGQACGIDVGAAAAAVVG